MTHCEHKSGVKSRATVWFTVACTSFALLIWAKLRLVTGVPRTAYATPESEQMPRPADAAKHAPAPGSEGNAAPVQPQAKNPGLD